MAETNETRNQKKKGCGFGCLALLGLLVAGLVAMGLLLGLLAGLGSMAGSKFSIGKGRSSNGSLGKDEMPDLEEVWSVGQGDVKVIRIPLTGMIMLDHASPLNKGTANQALRAIRRATHDDSVKGLILEIDSGGGGVTASDIIYQAVKNFKAEDEDRVVVTLMGDVAASGAYYVALASDKILAHPTTITGSIGVIMQGYNVQGLAEKLGVSDVTIKSGKNKDLLNIFHEVDPEQRAIIQKVVDSSYGRFVSLVAENRNLPKEKVLPLADGRVFSAPEAVENKLIDGIGYFEDARRLIAKLLKEEDVKIYRYEEEIGLLDLFANPGLGFSSGIQRLIQEKEPRLLYQVQW